MDLRVFLWGWDVSERVDGIGQGCKVNLRNSQDLTPSKPSRGLIDKGFPLIKPNFD